MILVVFAAVLLIIAVYYLSGPIGQAAFVLIVLIGMATVAVLLARQWILNQRRDFVAVVPAGVIIRLQTFRTRTIPWDRIVEVGLGVVGVPGRAALFYRGKKYTRFIVVRWVLHDAAERRQFARAVEEGKKRYGGR